MVHKASNRRISYGEIAAFTKAPAELPRIEDKDLKPAASFRLIGKDVPRVEVPLKLIPLVLFAAMGRTPSIKIFGHDYPTPDGTCIRDYVHTSVTSPMPTSRPSIGLGLASRVMPSISATAAVFRSPRW